MQAQKRAEGEASLDKRITLSVSLPLDPTNGRSKNNRRYAWPL